MTLEEALEVTKIYSVSNAEMTPAEVRDFCRTAAAAQGLLKAAMNQLHLSARAFHRVLKLARTIADLAGTKMIGAAHVTEAVQYQPRSRVWSLTRISCCQDLAGAAVRLAASS